MIFFLIFKAGEGGGGGGVRFCWKIPNPDFRIQKTDFAFLGGKSKNGS